MDTKPWYQSKTLWTNMLTLAALVVEAVMDTQGAGILPAAAYQVAALALTLVNIGLRFVTGKPIAPGGTTT